MSPAKISSPLASIAHRVLCARLARSEKQWPPAGASFAAAFAAAPQLFGKGPLALEPSQLALLSAAGADWPLSGWTIDEAARVVLLLEADGRLPPGELLALTETTFAHGDLGERMAVLRALPLLGRPGQFLALAVEGSRSCVQPVFEAIACDNPYPAAHFPEADFNQLVLKAVFTGVPLSRILGLGRRVTVELLGMAADYARQRIAAGRAVPADLALLRRSPLEAG